MKQMMILFRRALATDMVRVSFLNGISTLVRMIAGVVSTKVVASIVGPAGIALLGQLNNFTLILQSLANGGITTGVTKFVSEHATQPEVRRQYISAALRITVTASLACGLVMILGAGALSSLILRSDAYRTVFWLFGATIILYAMNALLLSVMNGFKAYGRYVRVNIWGSVISLVFSVTLALLFGLRGALVSVVTYQSVVFLVTLRHARQMDWFRDLFKKTGGGRLPFLSLLKFSMMALSSALIVPLSQLFVRGHIATHLSVSDAGIWEGVNRISGMYLQVVTASLSVYYLPRLSELKEEDEVRAEVVSVYKMVVPFLLLASMAIYVFRDLIITILFTGEFHRMRDLFFFQLLGDVLKMCGWVLGFIMVAKAMTRTYILMEVLNYSVFVVLSKILVSGYGVAGSTVAYAAGHAVYLAGMVLIFRRMIFRRS